MEGVNSYFCVDFTIVLFSMWMYTANPSASSAFNSTTKNHFFLKVHTILLNKMVAKKCI